MAPLVQLLAIAFATVIAAVIIYGLIRKHEPQTFAPPRSAVMVQSLCALFHTQTETQSSSSFFIIVSASV